jgi:hypothetical protein
MSGDTAHDNPYRNINPDYGKGVYFYHITNGFEYPSTDVDIMDLECADGLFYWSRSGTFSADWEDPNNPTYSLPFYVRDSVSYNNDITTPGMSNRDEMDVSDPSWSGDSRKWGSEGKLQQSQYGDGTDRIYTNKNDRWTSRSCLGDRWDAWRIGYNVVFSPYSSPSTRNWNNNNTNIFIYMSDSSNNEVDFKIYKVGQNGFTLDSILKVTPPSRPMGLKLEYTECEYGMRYPKLIWSHNMEPDMIDSSYNPPFHIKHYKIYRAYSDMNSVPGTFNEIADVYANSSTQPYYIDYSTYAQCGGGIAQENYRVRYEIKAVDNTSWASVFSDFVSTSTYELHRDDGDVMNNLEPKVYSLSQNYPNPFNPVTNIKYSIAYQGFVSLKIYDILGREIRTLVNEVKTPGEYFISFNGVDLASGIYFYRIKAGNFVSVKRMVLIK